MRSLYSRVYIAQYVSEKCNVIASLDIRIKILNIRKSICKIECIIGSADVRIQRFARIKI